MDTPEGASRSYTAPHVLIATGGEPRPLGIPGAELAISSDGFFELPHQPKRAAVLGAGSAGEPQVRTVPKQIRLQ